MDFKSELANYIGHVILGVLGIVFLTVITVVVKEYMMRWLRPDHKNGASANGSKRLEKKLDVMIGQLKRNGLLLEQNLSAIKDEVRAGNVATKETADLTKSLHKMHNVTDNDGLYRWWNKKSIEELIIKTWNKVQNLGGRNVSDG